MPLGYVSLLTDTIISALLADSYKFLDKCLMWLFSVGISMLKCSVSIIVYYVITSDDAQHFILHHLWAKHYKFKGESPGLNSIDHLRPDMNVEREQGEKF